MPKYNVNVSPKFEIDPEDVFISRLKSADRAKELGDEATEKNWKQLIGRAAFGGLPTTEKELEDKLNSLEVAVRTAFALPSGRPGGKRSLGTGFKLHPTYKSYMSTVRSAYEYDVELLDADGMPRARNDITDEIDAKRPVKNPEEKVLGCVETLIKVRDQCDDSNPMTVDADNVLINWLTTKGYKITLDVIAEAA